jgi:hypothetical protein
MKVLTPVAKSLPKLDFEYSNRHGVQETLNYMTPEVVLEKDSDSRADIFFLE